jgi:hypothetical protein
MPDRTRKRPKNTKALESWDNEGGTTSRAPQKDRHTPAALLRKRSTFYGALVRSTHRHPTGAAVSMGEPHTKIKLKEQIARFPSYA